MFSTETLGQVMLRMGFIFAVALIAVRLMGNRAIGQFSPFDFVLMVGIGDIVSNVALDTGYSLISGVEGLAGLLILQQLLSRAALKNTMLRKWFEGQPVVIIQDGKIIRQNLIKTQFNMDDLRQELHKYGMDLTNIGDIKLARLESCGGFTIVKNPDMEPLTKMQFEDVFKSMLENPLSRGGAEYAKVQRLVEDVRYLTEYIKQRDGIQQPQMLNKEQPTQEFH